MKPKISKEETFKEKVKQLFLEFAERHEGCCCSREELISDIAILHAQALASQKEQLKREVEKLKVDWLFFAGEDRQSACVRVEEVLKILE